MSASRAVTLYAEGLPRSAFSPPHNARRSLAPHASAASSPPMPSRWLEVSIRATAEPAEAAEAVTALFEKAGHGGVVVEPELVQGHEEDEAIPAPDGFSVLRTYLA